MSELPRKYSEKHFFTKRVLVQLLILVYLERKKNICGSGDLVNR